MAKLAHMFIKICGITSADAVSAAATAQVDAVGFVFAPSPRQVTPGQAAQLAALAPPGMLRIAVGRGAHKELPEASAQALMRAVGSAVDLDALRATRDELARQVRATFVRHIGELPS